MSKIINIKEEDIECYHITGFYYNTNKRFKRITTKDLRYAMSINLWKGSVWAVMKAGNRKLIKRV